ncbi:MAG TPA: YhjD/YihY/BrkB family envelope integrity protein [Polyangia bacterium]|nr:YhjD/YihY/BrkB family envelope integrity protein [Polyangia bacterium]
MRNTFNQLRAFFSTNPYTAGATHRLSGRARAAIYLYRLSVRILVQWAYDKCPQQAAALAFQTALSLVPVTAIALSILRAMGSLGAESQLLRFVGDHLFPQIPDVTERISDFSTKVSIGALGGLGLFFTLVTCYSLYSYVEKIFNDIWRVGQRRTLIGKFLTFYAMLTLLPTLAGASLYWSGKLIDQNAISRFLGPLFIQIAALIFMNKLLPRTQVSWAAATLGAMLTALSLEGLKVVFVKFAAKIMLQSYSGVYGPLGLVPLLLVWIYSSWLLVLLGAEIAHSLQNLRLLEAEDRRRRGDAPVNGLLAAQLLAAVAAAHESGGAGYPKDKLVTTFGLTPDAVEEIAGRLKKRGLIAEVHGDLNGYVPGRAARTITLEDVLQVFRSTDLEIAKGATSPAMQALVTELEATRQKRIAGVTIADLLPAKESLEPPPARARDAGAMDVHQDDSKQEPQS